MVPTHEAINLMIQFGVFVVALIALFVSLLNVGKKK
ncbi:MAG: putative holin-like toxin [Brevibacillus sp.]|nr:putative holin-like toxin [Brevibacillus sp.]